MYGGYISQKLLEVEVEGDEKGAWLKQDASTWVSFFGRKMAQLIELVRKGPEGIATQAGDISLNISQVPPPSQTEKQNWMKSDIENLGIACMKRLGDAPYRGCSHSK